MNDLIISENGTIYYGGLRIENLFESGYTTGQGVFETVLIYNGHTKFLKEHYDRLKSSSIKMNLPNLPEYFEVKKWVEEYILEISKYNSIENKIKGICTDRICSGRMRINWVKNTDIKRNKKADMHIYFMEFSYPEEYYLRGIKVGLSKERIYTKSRFLGVKTLNYAENLIGKTDAMELGFQEMIVLNEEKNVCECLTSNIFWIKDEKIYTPELKVGALPGIIRNWAIEHFTKFGYNVVEGAFIIDDIVNSDAMFLTNSLMGIMPVREIIEIKKNSTENKLLKFIMEKYMVNLDNEIETETETEIETEIEI